MAKVTCECKKKFKDHKTMAQHMRDSPKHRNMSSGNGTEATGDSSSTVVLVSVLQDRNDILCGDADFKASKRISRR